MFHLHLRINMLVPKIPRTKTYRLIWHSYFCTVFSRFGIYWSRHISILYIAFSENRFGNLLFINMFRILSIQHGIHVGSFFGRTSLFTYCQGDLLSSYCGVLGLCWEATLWTSKIANTPCVCWFASCGGSSSPSVAMERPIVMSPYVYPCV